MKYGKAADKSAKIRCLKRNKCTVHFMQKQPETYHILPEMGF